MDEEQIELVILCHRLKSAILHYWYTIPVMYLFQNLLHPIKLFEIGTRLGTNYQLILVQSREKRKQRGLAHFGKVVSRQIKWELKESSIY